MTSQPKLPEIVWAQRSSATDASKNIVYLTIAVSDVHKDILKLDIQPEKITYSGTDSKNKTDYHLEIDLFAEIDPSESKYSHTDRDTVIILRKKEVKQEYWPRLTKVKGRYNNIKTDFDKWVDEDEQNEKPEEDSNFDPSMMSQYGAGDAGGGFGGIDFSKLGGGTDLSGLGGMGQEMGGLPDDTDDDDEDMPGLEGEEEEEGDGKKDGEMDVDSTPVGSSSGKGKGPIELLD